MKYRWLLCFSLYISDTILLRFELKVSRGAQLLQLSLGPLASALSGRADFVNKDLR